MYYPLKSFRKKNYTTRYKIWLDQAGHDLNAALVSYDHQYYEWASYQAAQSAEKSLKSLIVNSGWRPPKTHKLSVLIGIVNSVNEKFRNVKFSFRNLELYTFVSRYPFLVPGEKAAPHDFVTIEDANDCIDEAKKIVSLVEQSLEGVSYSKFEDYEKINEIDIDKRLDSIKEQIIKLLKPSQIILFGGYAHGKKKLSTIDLLIIANTDLPFLQRIRLIREATKGGFPTVSPIIYTPEEFDLMLAGGEGFLENAVEEGRVIYKNQ